MDIQPFDPVTHQTSLAGLWRTVFGYDAPHNEPEFVIDRKLAVRDGLLFVAVQDGRVVGSIMAGYDGHRGWIYSLAVHPDCRKRGLGTCLVRHAEEQLKSLGCPKINLQIMHGNEAVEAFYRKLGYSTEPRISMGKKVPENIPPA